MTERNTELLRTVTSLMKEKSEMEHKLLARQRKVVIAVILYLLLISGEMSSQLYKCMVTICYTVLHYAFLSLSLC